ncbi:hypothetical protein NCAS_0B04230 [Naumovozyma castellii]|uniref:Inositolphosphotransferase Aur1/Ipt1 domain-containing protein n=1 Tax=Naumovozyma castellii TaxID=27288 RepID=G0VAI2_NAUCA|nr:hypothetical protein NCAS_0B04230 [Naumovozyma castellii CBS 4309]CCC68507.1 hypothetical protein NCAS_0B04230 [Naumovozyma castellii CBS 4309]
MEPITTVFTFIGNVYKSSFNQRNFITLPFNFTINFLPVVIWLFIFKHVGILPNEIRPDIHSKVAFLSDQYLFGDYWKELKTQYGVSHYTTISYFTSIIFAVLFLLLLPFIAWYYVHYIKKVKFNLVEWYDNVFHFNNQQNTKRLRIILFPYLTPFLVFVVLNIDHIFAYQATENFTKTKDIIAWFSYVILHVTVPVLTAVYLYVFHPAGTLKCFSFAMGLQNIAGVFTHILIPMASPWFTHMYGINDTEHVNYTQEGFAAGLTRVDNHLGTHLNTKGFHMSPIVFGAVPSLHSAIAFQCFLFLMTRSGSLKHRFINTTIPTTFRKNNEQQDLEMEPLSLVSNNNSSEDVDEDECVSSSSSSSDNINALNGVDEDGFKTDVNEVIRYYDEDPTITSKWYFKIFNKGLVPKILISFFIILQWWTTMYLDHHYRFDLFVGVLYSMISFAIINWFILQPCVLREFLDIRMGKIEDNNNEGRTLGMRVFQGTNYEWFFDPLA